MTRGTREFAVLCGSVDEFGRAVREDVRAAAPSAGHQKRGSDRGSPGLDQLALATMFQSGRYDRHLRRMRSVYTGRHAALAGALAAHAPRVRLSGLAAGFHAVAHLPSPAAEEAIVAAAGELSVGVYGMSAFRADGATEPTQLILGFGNTGERAIRAGIAASATYWSPGPGADAVLPGRALTRCCRAGRRPRSCRARAARWLRTGIVHYARGR